MYRQTEELYLPHRKAEQMNGTISRQALRRLPFYLDYLKKKQADGVRNISATTVANELKLNEVQVRKDLASVSVTGGKPKTGYVAEELIRDLESFLGYDNTKEAVIAGAGKLGQALLSYKEFDRYGLNIVAAFDTDESIIDSKRILPADKMADICSRLKVHIGIICVPPECAQSVCDKMVASGILAIWNFAPVHLSVPTGVIVQYENLAASLAVLSQIWSLKSGTVTFSDNSALFERKQYYEEHQHLRRSSCHLKGSYKIIELAKDYIANHNIGDKVNLGAAFCLGRCTDGVTIK